MKTKKSIPQNFAYRTFSSDTNRRIIFWVSNHGKYVLCVQRILMRGLHVVRLAQPKPIGQASKESVMAEPSDINFVRTTSLSRTLVARLKQSATPMPRLQRYSLNFGLNLRTSSALVFMSLFAATYRFPLYNPWVSFSACSHFQKCSIIFCLHAETRGFAEHITALYLLYWLIRTNDRPWDAPQSSAR